MARMIKVDMSGVEAFSRVGEGQHVAKLVAIDEKPTQGGDDMLVGTFEVTKGTDKGGRVYCNFPLSDKGLWKFKVFLQAAGIKADGKLKVDLDKLVGKTCIIEVEMEEYQGKNRPSIAGFKKLEAEASTDEDEEDDEDEEEEAPAPKKKAAPAPAKKAEPVKKGKKPEPEPEEEEEDEEYEDDEDEEEEPAPKKGAKKAPPAPPSKKAAPAKKGKKAADEDDDWDD